MLDEQFNIAKEDGEFDIMTDGYSGFRQVPDITELANAVAELTASDLKIAKSGYLYIYVSNETPDVDVFFDNLQVTHYRGVLFEETHYYPFGLIQSGISSKAAGMLENKKKYNGIELNTDFDLNIEEAFYRDLDPQTGRWWQVDPKIEKMENWSPYVSNYDNPILYKDPLGDDPDPPSKWKQYFSGVKDGFTGYFSNLGKQVSYNFSHPGETLKQGLNPLNSAKALASSTPIGMAVDAYKTTSAITSNLSNGNTYAAGKIGGEKAGEGVVALGTMAITDGVLKLSPFAKSGFGDLTKGKVKNIQKVVNETERPLEVIGSAASGTRRGVGSDLPIGKGPGTRSDIDYITNPLHLPYYMETQGNLPGLDFKTGVNPGATNPFMGPGIRFEPSSKPVPIPFINP